jgi:hypothetical protein
MCRRFNPASQNFFVAPGTPKDRVQILREAMRQTFTDPEFPKHRHQCVALAWSRTGKMTANGSWYVAGASAAKNDALKPCSAAGFKDCYVRSFSCSGRAW